MGDAPAAEAIFYLTIDGFSVDEHLQQNLGLVRRARENGIHEAEDRDMGTREIGPALISSRKYNRSN